MTTFEDELIKQYADNCGALDIKEIVEIHKQKVRDFCKLIEEEYCLDDTSKYIKWKKELEL